MEVVITRAEIQDKIRELVIKQKDPVNVKNSIETWLEEKNASDFDKQQILNDLTSYQEYLDLSK